MGSWRGFWLRLYSIKIRSNVMRPHVKLLRKKFEALIRRGVLKVDRTCCKCSKTADELGRRLELHHIVPLNSLESFDTFDPNVPSNLITFCHDCHQAYHKCYEKEYFGSAVLGYINDVPLEEAYASLQKYRDEKQRLKEINTLKHKSTNAKRNQVHRRDGPPNTG